MIIALGLFVSLLICNISCATQQAIVVKPVIDLVGSPTSSIYGCSDTSMHQKFGLSPVNRKDPRACPRIHQLLCNEQVTIMQEQGEEVLVRVPQVFYQVEEGGEKKNAFWTLRSNVVMLCDVLELDITKIPQPLDFTKPSHVFDQKILTLLFPFYAPEVGHVYSAGTRFVYEDCLDDAYLAYVIDPRTLCHTFCKIPCDRALSAVCGLSIQEKIEMFVGVLRNWVHQSNGFIPCVLGGISFTRTCNDPSFYQEELSFNGEVSKAYAYPTYNDVVKTGFDCSGLICRAAQICGIPFFFKNSTTMGFNLAEVAAGDQITHGDLIWIPRGHILVISDVEKGLCIDVRDYSHGYGKLLEMKIDKIFQGVSSIDELQQAALEQKTLYWLSSEQEVVRKVPEFKILKMISCCSH